MINQDKSEDVKDTKPLLRRGSTQTNIEQLYIDFTRHIEDMPDELVKAAYARMLPRLRKMGVIV